MRKPASPPKSCTSYFPCAALTPTPGVVKRKMSGYQLKHAHHCYAPTVNRYPAILK